MSKSRIFFDSSALIAGVLSPVGAARALMVMSEMGEIELLVSEYVIVETERTLARKVPQALPGFRQALKEANIKIVQDPSAKEVKENLYLVMDAEDVPMLLSAMQAKVDYLATHNRRHFLNDPKVAEKSKLQIGTPGDIVMWLREQIGK
jgi:predicted nucleic acid-binding protein